MVNLKAPCLSLDARGSVGNALTFTKRRGQNIAEKKPELPYFLTLPSQYQRWLYQDYAHLWTQQSVATKRQYAIAGALRNLTGFQYWMSYQLEYLPDIAGYWKLDDNLGATVIDSSRNVNTGTLIGASPAVGAVGDALVFDGLNDEITLGNPTSLQLYNNFTYKAWINTDAPAVWQGIYDSSYQHLTGGWCFELENNRLTIIYTWDNGGVLSRYVARRQIITSGLHRVAVTYGLGSSFLYLDGSPSAFAYFGDIVTNNAFGRRIGKMHNNGRFFDGIIDHVILMNRVQSQAEITIDAERRYP